IAMPMPEDLGWVQAGAIPESCMTAHDAMFPQCRLGMSERVLISGGAGGVGTAAIILAAEAGSRVTATVRNPDLREDVAQLGADAIAPEELEAHGPYDVIVELIGAPNMPANMRALATDGRIAVIGVGAGAAAELDLLALMGTRGTIRGSTIRARPIEERAIAAREVEAHVLPLFQGGRRRLPVAATYDLEQAVEAYAHFAAGGKLGKIVLTSGVD
ncbi:MAG: zinc-binding dehydrogenase, partial [Acidimicrobiales bacterium]